MTFTAKLKRWQGARTAAEAAAVLGVNLRTFEGWRSGRFEPVGFALKAVLAVLERRQKGKATP